MELKLWRMEGIRTSIRPVTGIKLSYVLYGKYHGENNVQGFNAVVIPIWRGQGEG